MREYSYTQTCIYTEINGLSIDLEDIHLSIDLSGKIYTSGMIDMYSLCTCMSVFIMYTYVHVCTVADSVPAYQHPRDRHHMPFYRNILTLRYHFLVLSSSRTVNLITIHKSENPSRLIVSINQTSRSLIIC